jgi:hypothetical protein
VEVGEEVVGEGRSRREIGERREQPLAGEVDLDFGADGTHGDADSMGRGRQADRWRDFE